MKTENFFNDAYNQLNENQKRAVDTTEGPVLVVAGPGSGKTQLLALRVANILQKTDTPPSSVLCLTFTDSAAINMRKRLLGMIGDTAYETAIHTFHSFGKEIIGRHPEYFYKGALFTPADELAKMQVLEDIFTDLPHDSPLNSYHKEHGYTYLKNTLEKISDLKKGGLAPEEFSSLIEENADFIEKANQILKEFFKNYTVRSKKDLPLVQSLINEISGLEYKKADKPANIVSLKHHILNTLQTAYSEAEDIGGTRPFTLWKEQYTKNNKKKERVFKDFENLEKFRALAKIYTDYQHLMAKKGLYDFDDMLLEVVKAFEENPDLKSTVQEKYLYILVDEFQDTSGVQMRLLNLLADAPVHEGRPNIMAVGDDDQAIYKFQGAKVQNILSFNKAFRDPAIIVLNKNYRSTQNILNLVTELIRKGSERLENLIKDVKKDLIAAKPGISDGEIIIKSFDKDIHELRWAAEDIKKKIATGHKPGEIAVISRKHSILEEAAKVFSQYGIQVSYERKKNVFDEIHIQQIIKILEFLHSINTNNQEESHDLLPDILSFLFWGIPRIDVWRIAVVANNKRKPWLEIMLASDNEKIKNLAMFLIALGTSSSDLTAEQIIDIIIGNKPINITDSEEANDYLSPFKSWYFNDEKLKEKPIVYFEFLYGLRTFIKAVRTHKTQDTLYLKNVIEFVDLHKKHKLALNDKTVLDKEENLVRLITAHSAKGLEFESVYILNAQDEIWGKTFNTKKLGLPCNLPFENEKENEDDLLRLLYVALSRAKKNLHITNFMYKDNGRESMPLRFFEGIVEFSHEKSRYENVDDTKVLAVMSPEIIISTKDEKEMIKSLLKDYRLSVTHLHNFLDIVHAGPQSFFERNLLKFPEAKTVSNAYGSAVHTSLEMFYKAYKQTGILPDLKHLQELFLKALYAQRLSRKNYEQMLDKGKKQLEIFYNENKEKFDKNDDIELNFKYQGVNIEGALLTGKIDRIKYDRENKEIIVFDYKTGKSLERWEGSNDQEKIKAWKYKDQISFYKLLIENSRDFRSYRVHSGGIIFIDAKEQDNKALSREITENETADLKKLINIVYSKIVNLDFPDVSRYPKSFKGIQEFVCELLAG